MQLNCCLSSGCSIPLGNSKIPSPLPKSMFAPQYFGMMRGFHLWFHHISWSMAFSSISYRYSCRQHEDPRSHMLQFLLYLVYVTQWWQYISEQLFRSGYFISFNHTIISFPSLYPAICRGYSAWQVISAIWLQLYDCINSFRVESFSSPTI